MSNVSIVFETVVHYYHLPTSVDLAITMAVITNTQLAIIKPCTSEDRFHHIYSYGGVSSSVIRWPVVHGWSVLLNVYSLQLISRPGGRLTVVSLLRRRLPVRTWITSVPASPSRVLLPTTIQCIWTLTRVMSYLSTVPTNTTELVISAVGCSWLRTSMADHLIQLCCHAGRYFCQ